MNGLRARLDFVLHWLKSREPDVVGFQELKLTDDQFPHDAFAELGYRSVCHGQKGWNGVAILSRQEAVVTQRGLPGQDEMGARLLTAQVEGLAFTTVYVPNGKTLEHEDFPRKLSWLETLTEHLGSVAGEPAVLCGDFNVCPAPLDSWRGEASDGRIFCTDEERTRYGRLLEAGFRDAFREQQTRSSKRSPGGTTGAAPSTAARACASTTCWRRIRCAAGEVGGDRSRLPQEEGRAHRLGPRAGVRRPGVNPSAPSRPFLGALLLATALAPISLQMFLPALPAIQEAFSVSAGVAQLALTLSMVAIAFATLGYGPCPIASGGVRCCDRGQILFVLGSLGLHRRRRT